MCQTKWKLKNNYFGKKNNICSRRNVITTLIYFIITALLVYLFIIFLKSRFNISNVLAICLFVVTFCAIGTLIIFSRSTLCFLSLLLPQICSKKGRTVIIAYVFVLTLKYPTKNLLHNIEVLTDSISCGQVRRQCYFQVLLYSQNFHFRNN